MAGINAYRADVAPLPPSGGFMERYRSVLTLLACILGILFLMIYACPRLESTIGLGTVSRYIDDRDIESNMYFYTEVSVFSDASIDMDNTRAYPPSGPDR